MNLKLNDRAVEAPEGMTLAQLLRRENADNVKIATAVNGSIVAAADRATHPLADGDSILVIKAFYGG